jgi:hypothetical protein
LPAKFFDQLSFLHKVSRIVRTWARWKDRCKPSAASDISGPADGTRQRRCHQSGGEKIVSTTSHPYAPIVSHPPGEEPVSGSGHRHPNSGLSGRRKQCPPNVSQGRVNPRSGRDARGPKMPSTIKPPRIQRAGTTEGFCPTSAPTRLFS